MAASIEQQQGLVTSREAADRAGFSRPDSLLRSWRAAGLPIFRRPSGRILVAESDLARFELVIVDAAVRG